MFSEHDVWKPFSEWILTYLLCVYILKSYCLILNFLLYNIILNIYCLLLLNQVQTS
jgi:hypothetical protein